MRGRMCSSVTCGCSEVFGHDFNLNCTWRYTPSVYGDDFLTTNPRAFPALRNPSLILSRQQRSRMQHKKWLHMPSLTINHSSVFLSIDSLIVCVACHIQAQKVAIKYRPVNASLTINLEKRV